MTVKNLVQGPRSATAGTGKPGHQAKWTSRKEPRLARLKHEQISRAGQQEQPDNNYSGAAIHRFCLLATDEHGFHAQIDKKSVHEIRVLSVAKLEPALLALNVRPHKFFV